MQTTTPPPLVVTRHPALVALLRERGVIGHEVDVRDHVGAEDVRGRHVIGILPLHLAAVASSVTVVDLALAPADRGVEISLERLREIAGPATRYRVTVEG